MSRLAGGSRRGRGFGWYHGVTAAVALPGAALFGWLYQVLGADVALRASAGATAGAVALLGLVAAIPGLRPGSGGGGRV